MKLYTWFHEIIKSKGEKGESSGGFFSGRVRKFVLDLCVKRSGRLLDVGCGEGLFLSRLASMDHNLELYGVDVLVERILLTRKKIEAMNAKYPILAVANADALPFAESSFDILILLNVLLIRGEEVLLKNMLRELARVCKKGGRLILDFRNNKNIFFNMLYKHANVYDNPFLKLTTHCYGEIKSLAEEFGFKVADCYGIGFFIKWLAPVVILEFEKV